MKLKSFLELHRACAERSPDSIVDALGDPILCVENPTFRAIRTRVVAEGAKFSSQGQEAYACLPLAQLDRVLATRVIPVRPMLGAFEGVEDARPGVLDIDELTPYIARKQAVFHESAHLIANRLIRDAYGRGDEDDRRYYFRAMLEEAYADAVETFANLHNGTPQAQNAYRLNSYMMGMTPAAMRILGESHAELGERAVLKLLTLFFLRTHFMLRELPAPERAALCALAAVLPGEAGSQRSRLVDHLWGMALAFTPIGRYEIAKVYFRVQGRLRPLEDALAFDPIALWATAEWSALLEGLVDAAEAPAS